MLWQHIFLIVCVKSRGEPKKERSIKNLEYALLLNKALSVKVSGIGNRSEGNVEKFGELCIDPAK